jgi:ABC-2 type transport system ATP-binding protein
MEEAETLCDRVAVMDAGEIIALDTPQKLVEALLVTGFRKEVEVRQADLEDVFIHLTGKALRE